MPQKRAAMLAKGSLMRPIGAGATVAIAGWLMISGYRALLPYCHIGWRARHKGCFWRVGVSKAPPIAYVRLDS